MSFLVPVSLLFAILVVAGAAWLVRRSGRVSGASSQGDMSPQTVATPGSNPGPPRSAIAQLKTLVHRGDWQRALPSILVIAGLLGVMLFGALALIVVFHQRSAGIPMLVIAIIAIARLALDYYRA